MSEEEKSSIEYLTQMQDYTILAKNKAIDIVLNLIENQQQELQLKDKVIKRAIERCKREIEVLDELLKED